MVSAVSLVVGYLIGCFSTSLILGKLFFGVDVRQHGSGNAGATNAYRVLGAKGFAFTFIGDCLKAVLAVYIGRRLGGELGAIYAAAGSVIGHNWPVFFKFKGGKGIATSLGAVLAINFWLAIVPVLIGIGLVIKYRYISLGSITAISIFPFIVIIAGIGIEYVILSIFLALLAIIRHMANIQRLLNGTESKIGQKNRVR